MKVRWTDRRLGVGVALLLAGAMALTGCGGAESPTSSAPDEDARAPAGAEGEQEGPAGADGERQGPGGKEDPQVGKPARDVIHTGELRLEVKDLRAAADKATTIAKDADGFVGGDERRRDDGEASAKLTLRIPAKEFSASLARISKLGKELRRTIAAEDVSEAVIDLDSRIEGQRASVKRIRALLSRAQSLSEISTVERELTKREAELAALEGRKRKLADQVAYSTLVVELFTKAPPRKAPKPAEIGFWPGLKTGWAAYGTTLSVALTVLGATLPFLVTIAVPIVALVWLLRRRRPAPARGGPPHPPHAGPRPPSAGA
ncbi:MAG: DUF4349 domain-containing protein [Micromonosporaceae bacterium]|nr:DUF4349 domain-containing protein [Micromonosporaceae bacterium]